MLNAFLGEDISIKVAADIRSCTFSNNTAAFFLRLYKEPVQPQDPLAGGAALDMLAVPYSMMADNVFLNNLGRQGSAVHLDSCTATVIWNGTFDGNSATHEGGAIATVNSHGKGVLIGRSIISNSLALSGGGVYGESGASVIITNSTRLVNNTAVTKGGAVNCAGCQNMTMQLQSSATGNQAQGARRGLLLQQLYLLSAQSGCSEEQQVNPFQLSYGDLRLFRLNYNALRSRLELIS